MPCGYVEYHEDYLSAAVREVKEETTVDVRIKSIISVVTNYLKPNIHSLVTVLSAEIIAGEIPCHKIFEDEETLAFMDVMPQSEGHCLVIPKKGSRNLLDAEPMTLGNLIVVTQMIARAAKKAFVLLFVRRLRSPGLTLAA